jgi:hypothetical protein
MEKGTLIQKEEISTLTFVENEVLTNPEDIERRKRNLDSAMQMGNSFKAKVLIVFDTTEGTFYTDTTIWAATEQYIDLKGGVNIPVRAIREIVL